MKFWCAILLVWTLPAVSAEVDLPVRGDKAEVEFLAVGRPSALRIRGVMKDDPADALSGTFAVDKYKMTGTVRLKLDSLETGISLRDRHMKEKYLETSKYPVATFTLTDLLIPRAFPNSPFVVEEEAFAGQLELHGEKKPIRGKVRMEYEDRLLKARFEFDTKVSDFKIAVPQFAGITVADDVKVTASVELAVPQQEKPEGGAP